MIFNETVMYWFILFILLLLFVPFLRLGLAFLVIFVIINILLLFGEIVFRLAFQKKQRSPFFTQSRPTSPQPPSPLGKDDDVEDAEFREEK